MGKLKRFDITVASPHGVYYAGGVLQGQVTIELSEKMSMRGIKLNFEGKAYVHWSESHSTGSGKNRRTTTRHYSAGETYFDQDVLLHGIWSGQGSGTTELPEGIHTFPFQFQLPPGLPSSFESHIGHVRYVVKCNIDKPWKFDHKSKCPFTVISLLDLNQTPAYRQRMQGSNEKNLCCLCCKDGPITASFSVNRQGYVPGEAINLFAEISNGAGRSMDKSYVDLKMVTHFHATSKTRTTITEVARVTRPGIEGHSEDSWTGEQLVIPPLPPSFLVGCRIIDIHYILQLNVDPSGPALDLEIPLEVVIGTIPLAQVVQAYLPTASPFGATAAPPSAPPSDELYPANAPPPSYSECVTGRVDIHDDGDNEHTMGNMSFAPAYTYYDWGHTPAGLPPQSGKNN